MVKENHVSAGADGEFDASGTGAHMQAYFALGDGAVRILEQAFNRLFDRLDKHVAVCGNGFGKCGHRRRTATGRRTGYQHETAVQFHKVVAKFRQVQVFKRRRFHRNNANGNTRNDIVPRNRNARTSDTRKTHRLAEIATDNDFVTVREALRSLAQTVHQMSFFKTLLRSGKHLT